MKMNRRQLLAAGTAGLGTVALCPLMRSVYAQVQARAAGAPAKKRFVFFMKSNGLWAENLQPTSLLDRLPFKAEYDADGRLVDGNHGGIRKNPTPAADIPLGADAKLNALMEPLEPFRKRMNILQGLDGGFAVYHDGHYQALGSFAARRRDTSEVGGATIDAILARAFPGPVPHICLGHDPKAASGVSYLSTSALDVGKPMPFYTKPKRAYKDLFGVIDKGEAKATYDMQSDILDFFAEDARRLRSRVAASEREQLDRYLGAFESVRESRRKIEAMSEQLARYAPDAPQELNPDATTLVGQGNVDIAIASLASGLTNVVTIVFDTLGNSSYGSFGIGGLHGAVGHGQGGKVLKKRQDICTFHYAQIARLAAALEAIPEGDGTMLDNTVIVYTSNNGETHHSSGVNWPVMTIGNLGGKLKTNRYYAPGNEERDRSKPGYTRLGDVWATLLEAAGRPTKGFGRPVNGVPHAPIASLLA